MGLFPWLFSLLHFFPANKNIVCVFGPCQSVNNSQGFYWRAFIKWYASFTTWLSWRKSLQWCCTLIDNNKDLIRSKMAVPKTLFFWCRGAIKTLSPNCNMMSTAANQRKVFLLWESLKPGRCHKSENEGTKTERKKASKHKESGNDKWKFKCKTWKMQEALQDGDLHLDIRP